MGDNHELDHGLRKPVKFQDCPLLREEWRASEEYWDAQPNFDKMTLINIPIALVISLVSFTVVMLATPFLPDWISEGPAGLMGAFLSFVILGFYWVRYEGNPLQDRADLQRKRDQERKFASLNMPEVGSFQRLSMDLVRFHNILQALNVLLIPDNELSEKTREELEVYREKYNQYVLRLTVLIRAAERRLEMFPSLDNSRRWPFLQSELELEMSRSGELFSEFGSLDREIGDDVLRAWHILQDVRAAVGEEAREDYAALGRSSEAGAVSIAQLDNIGELDLVAEQGESRLQREQIADTPQTGRKPTKDKTTD